MNWAEQAELQLGDLERTFADDPGWHASMRRLRSVMTLRQHLRGRRGPILACAAALAASAVLLLLGLWLIVASAAVVTALIAGCAVAGGIVFAVVFAVLDPHAAPPIRERSPK